MEKYNFIKFNKNDISIEVQQERIDSLKEVIIPLDISLAKIELPIKDIQKFSPGYIFPIGIDISELNVNILTNDEKKIATGEIVMLDHKAYVKIINIETKEK